MDLKNLQKKLFERKLGITEYFGVGYDAFKILLKENKLLVFLQFLFLFAPLGLIVTIPIFSKIARENGYSIIVFALIVLFIFILINVFIIVGYYYSAYFFRKVALKLEGREKEFTRKGIIVKALAIYGITAAVRIFFSVLERAGILGSVLALFCEIAIIVVFILHLLYFDVYYIRNSNLLDSVSYSSRLSSKNRLRKIVPIVIVLIIVIVMTIIYSVIFFQNNETNFIIPVIVYIIIFVFSIIFVQILNIVIFLNVESDYLKNQEEHIKFDLRNKQKNDEFSNSEFKNEIENRDNGLK